jgi:hypothetical protein
MSQISFIEAVVDAFRTAHDQMCIETDMHLCTSKHADLIAEAKQYKANTEKRVRAEVAGQLDELKNMWMNAKEPSRSELVEWLNYVFDLAIKFTEGEK